MRPSLMKTNRYDLRQTERTAQRPSHHQKQSCNAKALFIIPFSITLQLDHIIANLELSPLKLRNAEGFGGVLDIRPKGDRLLPSSPEGEHSESIGTTGAECPECAGSDGVNMERKKDRVTNRKRALAERRKRAWSF